MVHAVTVLADMPRLLPIGQGTSALVPRCTTMSSLVRPCAQGFHAQGPRVEREGAGA